MVSNSILLLLCYCCVIVVLLLISRYILCIINNHLIISNVTRVNSTNTHDANIHIFWNMQPGSNFFVSNLGRNVRGAQATNARGNIA